MAPHFALKPVAAILEAALDGALVKCTAHQLQQLDRGRACLCVAIKDLLSPDLDSSCFSVVYAQHGRWPLTPGYVLIWKKKSPCRTGEPTLCCNVENVLRCWCLHRPLRNDAGRLLNLCRECPERRRPGLPQSWRLRAFD
jgi:hypothetical protein